jgi:hypothetical protein
MAFELSTEWREITSDRNQSRAVDVSDLSYASQRQSTLISTETNSEFQISNRIEQKKSRSWGGPG